MVRPKFRLAVQPPVSEPAALSELEQLSIREAAFREALHQAWFATGLEQTKSVFTLASAGVGLALTLTFGDHTKCPASWAPVWLFLAAIALALSSFLCILVFRVNGQLVAKLVQNANSDKEDGLVGRLDLCARTFFGVGLLFLLLSAVSQIWIKGC